MQYFTSVHLEQACVAIVEQLHLWESLVMHLRVKVSKWHYFATWMISISPADLNMRLAVKAKPVNHKQLEKRCCLSWAEETCRARSVLIFRGRKERTRSSSKLFCCSHVYWAGQGYFIESCNDPYKCSSSKKIAIIIPASKAWLCLEPAEAPELLQYDAHVSFHLSFRFILLNVSCYEKECKF